MIFARCFYIALTMYCISYSARILAEYGVSNLEPITKFWMFSVQKQTCWCLRLCKSLTI